MNEFIPCPGYFSAFDRRNSNKKTVLKDSTVVECSSYQGRNTGDNDGPRVLN